MGTEESGVNVLCVGEGESEQRFAFPEVAEISCGPDHDDLARGHRLERAGKRVKLRFYFKTQPDKKFNRIRVVKKPTQDKVWWVEARSVFTVGNVEITVVYGGEYDAQTRTGSLKFVGSSTRSLGEEVSMSMDAGLAFYQPPWGEQKGVPEDDRWVRIGPPVAPVEKH
jgi:hypothetical protein